jgi:hypothetical protein
METFGNFLLIVSGSAFGGFIFKLLEKLFEERLTRDRAISADKRQLAREVIKLLAEGNSSKHRKQPQNMIEVSQLIEQVTFEDEKVGKILKELVNTWIVHAILVEEADNKTAREFRSSIKLDYETLKKQLRKWR